MTKAEARAILRLSGQILRACDQAEKALQDWPQLANAQSYWLAHLRSIANGHAYGSIPVVQAMEVLEQ